MEMNSSCSMKRVPLLVAIAIGLYFMNPTEARRTIIDITHTYYNVIPAFGSPNGSKPIIHEQDRDGFQTGYYTVGTHYGTHVDTPQHLMSLIDNPISVPTLDLLTLIGPVLVVRIPTGVQNITAQVVCNLGLPTGLERVIFKTDNTDRCLMNQIPFEKNYAGLMPDAAEWLVKNTTIKFIGVDYMSVASFNYAVEVHEILLNKPGVIPVECLNLEGVEPGYYDVYCLPTKVETEGAPARCILMKPTKAKRTILDITHTLKNYMTVWKNYAQTKEIIREHNGTHFRTGEFTVGTDYGTHVDSPQHLLSLKDSPISALTLDLQTLIGRVLVVRIPTGVRNITAQVVSNLGLPRGIKRVIFKTDNTDRRLMNKIAFETDYTGLTPDAADLLVKNTTIKFIGVDYMSVASFDYHHQVHEILLNKPGVIPVECLNLKGVEPGYYDVYCLPIKVAMEAATARCILMNTRH